MSKPSRNDLSSGVTPSPNSPGLSAVSVRPASHADFASPLAVRQFQDRSALPARPGVRLAAPAARCLADPGNSRLLERSRLVGVSRDLLLSCRVPDPLRADQIGPGESGAVPALYGPVWWIDLVRATTMFVAGWSIFLVLRGRETDRLLFRLGADLLLLLFMALVLFDRWTLVEHQRLMFLTPALIACLSLTDPSLRACFPCRRSSSSDGSRIASACLTYRCC